MYTMSELMMIQNIMESDYNNNPDCELVAVWANCLNCGPNDFDKTSIPGVVSSLSKKGLVTCWGEGADKMIQLTREGYNLYVKQIKNQ